MKVARLVAMAGFVGAAATAQAQVTTFQATTFGCFGAGCLVGANATNLGLQFTGSSFTAQTSSSGFLALGGVAPNLGGLALDNADNSYNSPFTLRIDFTQPGVVAQAFSATVTGSVSSTAGGGVRFDFDNNPVLLSYGGGSPPNGGLFTLVIDDQSVFKGQTATLSGAIQTVPEPSSMALLGTGLVGLVPMIRRRNKK